VLAAAIPVLYLAVFGAFLLRTGDSDWDQILSFHELSLWNGQLQGVARQWNPLMRGGMSLAGDPQVPIFSLSMILARVIHPAAAIKIAALLFPAAGAPGIAPGARPAVFRKPPRSPRRSSPAAASSCRASHGHVVSRDAGLPLWLWARAAVSGRRRDGGSANRRLLAFALAGGASSLLDGRRPITILLLWPGSD
jgi:hypothetical protein